MLKSLVHRLPALALAVLSGLAAGLWLAPWLGLFDLLRQIWPVLLPIAALAALISLYRAGAARAGLSALALIAILIPGLDTAMRGLARHGGDPDSSTDTLTVVTHNLWGEAFLTSQARDVLLASDADIIAFQESYDSDRLMATEFGETYPHAADCHESARIRSRLPMLDSGCIRHAPDTDWLNSSLCELDLPPSAWARFEAPDGAVFHVVSVHMDWPSPMGVQDCERANLAMHLARFPNDRLIVMGDFNAADPSIALQRLARDFRLNRLTHGLPSFPSRGRFKGGLALIPLPVLGIDHVFAGDDWELLTAHRLDDTGSDHRPVRVQLRLSQD